MIRQRLGGPPPAVHVAGGRRDGTGAMGHTRVGGQWWAVVLATGLAGCGVQPSGPPAPQPTTPVPTLTLPPRLSPTQDRGGLSVSAGPVAYTVATQVVETVEERGRSLRPEPSPRGGPSLQTPVRSLRRTRTPTVVVAPGQVAFAVTVVNRLDHVFRGQGAVVQVLLNGQSGPGGDVDGHELTAMILPPGGQQQVTVFGPDLASVPAGTAVTLNLFDLVTATDPAGNPTRRESLSWPFTMGVQNVPLPPGMGPPTVDYTDEPIGRSILVAPDGPGHGGPGNADRIGGNRRPDRSAGPTTRRRKP